VGQGVVGRRVSPLDERLHVPGLHGLITAGALDRPPREDIEVELSFQVSKDATAKAMSCLDAAAAVVRQRGFDATSFADVCERLGISRGKLTHHFPTKEALLTEMVRVRFQEFAAIATRAEDTADPRDALEAVMRRSAEAVEGDIGFQLAMMGSDQLEWEGIEEQKAALAAVVSRIIEVQLAYPAIVFISFFVIVFRPSFLTICVAIGLILTPGTTRVVRGATIAVRHQPYLEAAVELGVVGLILFLRMYILAWRGLQRARARLIARGSLSQDQQEQVVFARVLQFSLIANAVAGFFLSMTYATVLWTIFGICMAIMAIAEQAPGANSDGSLGAPSP